MSRPALVTGATGFIGTRLVELLLDDGLEVRAFVRSPDRLPRRLRSRVELVVGSLASPEAVRRAVHGAGMVFHLAGLATAWARRPADYFTINVEGTRRVLVAAQREGAGRVVHVSTVLTRFPDGGTATPYVASKRLAEQLVGRYVAAGGNAVTVNPCRVYGPGPLNDANGATRLIRSFLGPGVAIRLRDHGSRASYVHVEDVARGMLLAGRRGRTGASYVLGGENASVEKLARLVAELSGRPVRCLAVPRGPALALAGAMELGGRIGAPVPITRAWVRSFLQDQAVDIRPTTDAIGFRPRPLRAGVLETIDWLQTRNGGAP